MNPDLAQKWRHFKETGDEGSRDWLITHYVPLVVYVARRAVVNAPAHQDRAEFESFGWFGLIDAVEKFDPGRNVKFETYAIRRIQGAILDGLRRDDPLTRSARKRVKEVEATVELLEARLGRTPTVEDIATELDADPADIRITMQTAKTLTTALDTMPVDDDGENVSSLAETLADVRFDEPELHAEVSELQEIVASRLAALPERDRTFAALYYVDQMSLTEIGHVLGISESRVGQIRLRVINQLRSTAANVRCGM